MTSPNDVATMNIDPSGPEKPVAVGQWGPRSAGAALERA